MFLTVSFHTTRGNFFFFWKSQVYKSKNNDLTMTFCALLLSRQKQNLQSLQCSGHSSQFQSENSNETLQKFVKNVQKVKNCLFYFCYIIFPYVMNGKSNFWVFVCTFKSKTYDRFCIVLLECLSSTNFEIGRSAAVSDVCLLG